MLAMIEVRETMDQPPEPSDVEIADVIMLWGAAAGLHAEYHDNLSQWAFCDDTNTYETGFGGRDDRFRVWDGRTIAVEDTREVDIDTLLVWSLAVISDCKKTGRDTLEAARLVLDAAPRDVDGSYEPADPTAWERICVAHDEWEAAGDPLGPAAANWLRQFEPGIGRIDGWRRSALASVRAAYEDLTIPCPRCRGVASSFCSHCKRGRARRYPPNTTT